MQHVWSEGVFNIVAIVIITTITVSQDFIWMWDSAACKELATGIYVSFLIWEGFLLPHQCPAHQPLPTECGNAEGMAWSLFSILVFFTQLSLIRNRLSSCHPSGECLCQRRRSAPALTCTRLPAVSYLPHL